MPHNDTPKILTGKLTALRNAAYQEVKDDPVHWLYSGDADMALSRRYCETVMQRASQCDAVLACGSYVTNCHNLSQFDQLWSNTGCDFPELHYDNLPMSGCSMIYMDWFKSFGMKNELESIYLVLRAWLSGKNTLVCRMPECAVLALRSPNANYSVVEHYNGGRQRKILRQKRWLTYHEAVRKFKRDGIKPALAFLHGYRSDVQPWSENLCDIYHTYVVSQMMHKYLRRTPKMLTETPEMIISHPPSH